MHYLIDGYNLLFRMAGARDDLRSQREQLIAELTEKIEFLKLNVSLVFDSHSQEGDRSRSHFHSLEICFTAEGETADAYILSKLKSAKNPSQETVVTSDKTLAWKARRHLARTEAPEVFLSWVHQRYDNRKQQKKKEKHPSDTAPSSSQEVFQKDPEMRRWLKIFEERLKERGF
ncbi:MAG: NYN domain-containing protein [Waddliaceae bacterium]